MTTVATHSLKWYRTTIDPNLFELLNRRNNLKGLIQALGHLSLLAITGVFCFYTYQQQSWLYLIGGLFIYGTIARFLTNGIHELLHGTVFTYPWLNNLFLFIFSLIRWENHPFYWGSHTEHHKYTLYPPQDQEVVLPVKFTLTGFLKDAIFDPFFIFTALKKNLRYVFGILDDGWESYLFEGRESHKKVIRQAWILLLGHTSIFMLSFLTNQWILFLLLSLSPMYGGLLFFLCNHAQHSGLMDNVSDFRLNCRTIYINPILEFLYWKMNYHTEHHMYAAVPFYNLPKLHEAIKHDLPPTKRGLIPVWQEILGIQFRQLDEPDYQYKQNLPSQIDGSKEKKQKASKQAGIVADLNNSTHSAKRVWECSICGFIYDEAEGRPDEGIAPGTAWHDIPDDWRCPDCGVTKAEFNMVEIKTRAIDKASDSKIIDSGKMGSLENQ